MNALLYHLRQALGGIRRNGRLQLAALGALALALTLVGLAALVASNVHRLTAQWGRGEQLTVFMKTGAPRARTDAVHRLLASRAEVATVSVVTPQQAHQLLRESLSGNQTLQELGPAYLPFSLEVRLRPGHARRDLGALLALLTAAPGVAQVEARADWVERVATISAVAREIALAVALIIALAALYIVATTIRLGVHARRQEIEIQRLVGATPGFVRAPFLIEGALQGLAATVLSLALLFGAYRLAFPALQEALSTLLAGGMLHFFSAPQLLVAVLAGSLLGVAGSTLALGRQMEV